MRAGWGYLKPMKWKQKKWARVPRDNALVDSTSLLARCFYLSIWWMTLLIESHELFLSVSSRWDKLWNFNVIVTHTREWGERNIEKIFERKWWGNAVVGESQQMLVRRSWKDLNFKFEEFLGETGILSFIFCYFSFGLENVVTRNVDVSLLRPELSTTTFTQNLFCDR